MQNIINKNLDRKTISYFSGEAKKIILNRGIETDNLRKVVDDFIDEEKLRNSEIDFGLVTVELGPISPVKLFKEDIPDGKVKDFIMASARYPGLKMDHLDGNVNVVEIQPSMNLGGAFIFTQEIAHRNIRLGYYDTIKVIKKLKGREYYIEPTDEEYIFSKILEMPDEVILNIGASMGLGNIQSKRMLFEFIIPNICKFINEIKSSEKEYGYTSKINVSIKALKRLAIENLTKVNVELITDELLEIIK